MARPRLDPHFTAPWVISVRLTPLEAGALEKMVQLQNGRLVRDGLPPAITGASFLKSLIVARARSEGLLPGGPAASSPEQPPLEVHPPRIRPYQARELPPMTLWEPVDASSYGKKPPVVEPKLDKPSPGKSRWEWLLEEDPFDEDPPVKISAGTKRPKKRGRAR